MSKLQVMMRIEIPHQLGQPEAVRRIDGGIERLRNLPASGGLTVDEFNKTWSGNILTFSCRIKKFFFGTTLSAQATVTEDRVVLEFDPPALLSSFLAEDRIKQGVEDQIVPLLR
ncbi:MAG TPA: polyhydroxyalkanoic acid system family protein [Verrucomicrobiaceae bacterium]